MKSALLNKPTLQEYQWKEIREEFQKHNPVLAKIIDELNPSKHYSLFKASYPFGSEIMKQGILQIPDKEGYLIPINSPYASSHIQNSISYNYHANPVCMVLKNSTELFMILENHTIPLYGLITPGRVFGAWIVLNPLTSQTPTFLWNMTAGSRSIFMLPKISETDKYKRLKKEFNLKAEVPRSLLDHWQIFREIASHPNFSNTWNTEILYFSRKWFEKLDDKKWISFRDYLYKTAWEGSEFWRNQFVWDLVFSLIQRERRIKPNPYISDTAKHLIGMGVGASPGFAPAITDIAAPIQKLQEAYANIYKLEYAPIIMEPHNLSAGDLRPIYYSIQYPTTMEFSPSRRERSSKIFELYEIKSLLSKYLTDIRNSDLNVSKTTIYELPTKIDYDFFHIESEGWSGIRTSKEIPLEDKNFSQLPKDMKKNFPLTNPFVRGCIRLKFKSS